MTAVVIVALSLAAVLVLGAAWVIAKARAETRQATERAASAIADSFAREAKAAAQKKIDDAASNDVAKVEGASHEDLLRTARDLARRK